MVHSQGGTWVMPAIRTTGIGPIPEVECRIETRSGERVGVVVGKTHFYLATDGWLEVQAYPIPIVHAAPNQAAPIDNLYGVEATLECEVRGGIAARARQVGGDPCRRLTRARCWSRASSSRPAARRSSSAGCCTAAPARSAISPWPRARRRVSRRRTPGPR